MVPLKFVFFKITKKSCFIRFQQSKSYRSCKPFPHVIKFEFVLSSMSRRFFLVLLKIDRTFQIVFFFCQLNFKMIETVFKGV